MYNTPVAEPHSTGTVLSVGASVSGHGDCDSVSAGARGSSRGSCGVAIPER